MYDEVMGRKKRPSSIVRLEVDSVAEGVAVCRNITTQEIVRIESHPLLTSSGIRM